MKFPISKVLALLLLSAFGCGSSNSGPSAVNEPTRIVKMEKRSFQSTEKEIQRNDLRAALSAGPAALLAKVQTKAILNNGKFVGFKIVRFNQGEPKIPELRVGDVVISINGHKVERPEDYFEIFQKLKTAKELSFNILRSGVPESLKYAIVD